MSDLACGICEHYHQHLGRCGEPVIDDIYVSDSAYGGKKRFYRSMITDTCQCRADLSCETERTTNGTE